MTMRDAFMECELFYHTKINKKHHINRIKEKKLDKEKAFGKI